MIHESNEYYGAHARGPVNERRSLPSASSTTTGSLAPVTVATCPGYTSTVDGLPICPCPLQSTPGDIHDRHDHHRVTPERCLQCHAAPRPVSASGNGQEPASPATFALLSNSPGDRARIAFYSELNRKLSERATAPRGDLHLRADAGVCGATREELDYWNDSGEQVVYCPQCRRVQTDHQSAVPCDETQREVATVWVIDARAQRKRACPICFCTLDKHVDVRADRPPRTQKEQHDLAMARSVRHSIPRIPLTAAQLQSAAAPRNVVAPSQLQRLLLHLRVVYHKYRPRRLLTKLVHQVCQHLHQQFNLCFRLDEYQ